MRHLTGVIVVLLLSLMSLAGGVLLGRILWWDPERSATAEVVQDEKSVQDEEPEIHVDLTRSAVRSLGLRFGTVERETFRKSILVPGIVIEKPGQSGVVVTSPTNGIIRQIHRFPGQVLNPGDLLFTLQVMDEALETAQLTLLETLSRIEVTQRELTRLDPLAETGAVAGRRKLEMEYELEQLKATRAARLQELKLRGLDADQIDRILNDQELVSEIAIRLDDDPSAGSREEATESGSAESGDQPPVPNAMFTVESIDVFPGRAVKKGEELAHVASHRELYLRGEAFDSDVPAIRKVVARGWKVEAEFGEAGPEAVELDIIYIDNHVDATTNTFPFYMTLANRVVSQRRDQSGRVFWSWKYKPGQRSHLRIPVQQWPDQIVLPREATVRVGPETMVFRLDLAGREPSSESGTVGLGTVGLEDILADLDLFELEPVAVHVLHQDRRWSVIADDGALEIGDIVALNRAYQLHLAWRLQRSGGDLHDHDHDH